MTHAPDPWYRHGQVPHARPAGRLELDPDIDQALDDLRRAFPGICIWHGEWSGSLWALRPARLVEARTAADLARQLHNATPQTRQATAAHRPAPSTRRPDGTWTSPESPACGFTRQKKSPGGILRWLLTTCLHLTPASPCP
ncbi:hypothetical protein [Actinomadura sp. 9N215]|uniref:hypothetical protein n=1 Tax=Actinomadura sp. 9N215 TaxID=3375150 RepID=UPI0037A43AE3